MSSDGDQVTEQLAGVTELLGATAGDGAGSTGAPASPPVSSNTAPEVQPKGHVTTGAKPGFPGYMKGCRCEECTEGRAAADRKSQETRARGGAPNGRGSRRRTPAAQVAREPDANIAQVLAAGAGTSRAGAHGATEEQITEVLGGLVVFLSVQFAMWIAFGDRNAAAPLSLTDEEGEELVQPVARLLRSTNLNRKYGAAVIEWSSLLVTAYVLASYYQRVRVPLKEHLAQRAMERQYRRQQTNGASPDGQIPQPPVGQYGPVGGFGST